MTTPFQTLKNALIACFSKSKEAKLQQLFDGEQIGDRTLSQFLRHLKALVPGIDEAVLKSRWMSSLPDQTKALLTVQSDESLEKLAEIADKIHEVFNLKERSTVAVAAAPPTPPLDTASQIAELTKQIAELKRNFNSGRQRNRSRGRTRERPRSKFAPRRLNKTGVCFYHAKYGKKARNCSDGCKFQENNTENH